MSAVRRLVLRGARRLVWLGGGLALATLALAALLVVAVTRGLERDRIVELLEARLGRALGAEVGIGALEGTLAGGFVARDVAVRARGTALTLATLDVAYDLGPLLRRRRLEIERLRVEGLRATVEWTDDGLLVSGLPQPIGGGEPAADEQPSQPLLRGVAVGVFELADAVVTLRRGEADRRTDVALTAAGAARAITWTAGAPPRLPADATLTLGAGESAVAGRPVERIDLAVALADRSLRVERGALASPDGRLALTGEATFARDTLPLALARAEARAEIASLDVGAWLAQPRLASSLDGAIDLGFEPASPEDASAGRLRAEADLRSERLGAAGLAAIRLRGEVDTGSGRFRLEQLLAQGAAGTIRASAAGDRERLEQAALQAALALGKLPAAWVPGGLTGDVAIDASASGALADPAGRIELTGRQLRRAEFGPATLRLAARLAGGRRLVLDALALDAPELAIESEKPATFRLVSQQPITIAFEDLALRLPGGRVTAAGRASAERIERVELGIAIDDLAEAAALAGLEQTPTGAVAGTLRVEGPVARPAVRGTLVAAPIGFGGRTLERVELEIAPAGDRVVARARVVDAGSERLVATARVAEAALWSAPGTLAHRADTELRLQADTLDLAWLGALAGREDIALAGTLALDVTATGASPQPRLDGRLRLDAGSLALGALEEPVGPIVADLRLSGTVLRVETLRVAGRPGAILASGHLHWGGRVDATETDLAVAIDGFAVPAGLPLAGRLDGALALRGTWPAIHLGGKVTLSEGRVSLDAVRRADPAWREIRIHGVPGEEPVPDRPPGEREAELPGFLDPATANVEIAIEETWVQGRGADLRVAGDVRILKSAADEPIYVGSIEVLTGRFQYQNRRLDIARGVVTLTGRSEIDPELDVVAQLEQRDVTLRVVVTGRASAPTVTLESDPPLDPTDQLSYLAFGRPASDLGGSDAARLESMATQVVGSMLLGAFGERLPGGLALEAGPSDAGGASIGIGAAVAPGVYLRYAHDVSAATDRVQVEWRFLPRWSLQSEISPQGGAGGDVIWTYEW